MNGIAFIFCLTWKLSMGICGSFQGTTTCCSGSFWSEEKSACEKCPLGYHSFNCSEICKFPTFGDDCQHICNCSKDLCSHINGCKISNGIFNSSITSMVNRTSEKMYQTTQLLTEKVSSDGKPLERPPLPYNILYIIISLGYKSLNQLDTNRSVNSLRDSTYLEPLFDARLHYDEIENQDELSATGIVRVSIKRQNEETVQICTRSKSCHLFMHEHDETVAYNTKRISCTHSL
eukprot:XP_011451957.1 PREDICTED: uncharacterized protein LOC105345517 [Crassostrea gigas]